MLGSSFHKPTQKYVSQICVNGKYKHLGLFSTPQEAHDRYIQEKRIIHPFGKI